MVTIQAGTENLPNHRPVADELPEFNLKELPAVDNKRYGKVAN